VPTGRRTSGTGSESPGFRFSRSKRAPPDGCCRRLRGHRLQAHTLGFSRCPSHSSALAGYPALVEAVKRIFYHTAQQTPPARRHFSASRQLRRRSRFSTAADRFAVPSGHR
jgi:hypothetical protein